ncbi:uncharacterized protein [Melopsittacus undulatus]|uniref:uncharacterized protein isoform X2 n=1 Tax=Melopsittacus undulatus TaxID=13146 RepID=UPI00146AF7A5|nr:fetal and adult testis-expressed transcript protein isoform X2 [Melopsittacus undulatus]
MWLFWGPDPNRIRCDVPFTEAINQRMQVPSRLRVTDSLSPVDEEPVAEEVSPSLRMHIPDRISLADTPDASLRPMLLTPQREIPSVMVHMESSQSCLRDAPDLHITSRSSSQKRKRSGHHSSKSRQKTPSDSALLAMHSPGQHRERSQEAGPAPESALEEAGMTEMAAMRKQLTRISSRVRVLEEQCKASQQKEVLIYSVLISACLINTWLWMRR